MWKVLLEPVWGLSYNIAVMLCCQSGSEWKVAAVIYIFSPLIFLECYVWFNVLTWADGYFAWPVVQVRFFFLPLWFLVWIQPGLSEGRDHPRDVSETALTEQRKRRANPKNHTSEILLHRAANRPLYANGNAVKLLSERQEYSSPYIPLCSFSVLKEKRNWSGDRTGLEVTGLNKIRFLFIFVSWNPRLVEQYSELNWSNLWNIYWLLYVVFLPNSQGFDLWVATYCLKLWTETEREHWAFVKINELTHWYWIR